MKKNYVHPIQGISSLLLWACLLLPQSIWAQSIPDAQWARVGSTLAITTDGNIVTSADLPGAVPLATAVGLKKYDLQGNLVWQTGPLAGVSYIGGKLPPGFCPCVGGTAVIDRIGEISTAPDGGIRLLGNELGGRQILASVDATGHQTGSSYSGGYNLLTTPDGGNLSLRSFDEYLGNGFTRTGIVVEKTGTPSWTTRVFVPDGGNAYSVTSAKVAINTPDGGYLLAGQYLNSRYAIRASWVAKLDGQGNISWQTIISIPSPAGSPSPNDVSQVIETTDAIISADGSGYALVGPGTTYSQTNTATILVEIDLNGKVKQGPKAIDTLPTGFDAYITTYTGSNGKKYYAVGNTFLQGRSDPQILLIDPAGINVVSKRIFPGPGASSLIDIATAGDGSLVFVTSNNQLVKLQPEPTTQPPVGALALIAPTYNCATGAFTFNTSGGNGATIEYAAPGITGWTTNPNQFVDQGSRTANDVQPFNLMARQNGVTVTYVWDLKAACGRLARTAALPEPGTQLRVRVLGNPVLNQTAEVDITGAEYQVLHLNLVDLQGRVLHQQRIEQTESVQRVRVPMGAQSGLFLLNVSTTTQHQQVKLVKP